MSPRQKLAELAEQKKVLLAQIAVRRWETAGAGARLARPLAFIDRCSDFIHNFSPVLKGVGIPLALLVWKKIRERKGKGTTAASGGLKLAMLFETLPLVFQGISAVSQMRARRKPPTPVF